MIGLDPREFRVAVCLLQFADKRTRAIFPSQARIAVLLGCSVKAVERAIARLVADGWLERRRPNRHLSNSYAFVEAKRDAMSILRASREELYLSNRWGRPDPSEVSDQPYADPSNVSGPDPSDMSPPDPSDVSGKHLKGTLEREHYDAGALASSRRRVAAPLSPLPETVNSAVFQKARRASAIHGSVAGKRKGLGK